MKKIVALVCFAVGAAACMTEPSSNKEVTSNANRPMESKSMAMPSEAEITSKEKAAWDAIKKKDWDAFGKILASDYLEVLDNGVHDKAASIANVKDFELSDVTFSDWKMLPVDKDAVIITYSATVKGMFKGAAVPAGPYREASAYVNRDGQWLAIYYQETLAKKAPPPSPSKATPSKSAASPTSKPPEAGPDAAANEKLVWDALKAKNYDAFASYPASGAMEIEADGVYDKAGSVKNVSMFDGSKAELSEWKTVKFDNDASLVTYLVKLSGMKPDQERHSTIWVNRNGKWQALFHQGTPVAPMPAAKPEKKKM